MGVSVVSQEFDNRQRFSKVGRVYPLGTMNVCTGEIEQQTDINIYSATMLKIHRVSSNTFSWLEILLCSLLFHGCVRRDDSNLTLLHHITQLCPAPSYYRVLRSFSQVKKNLCIIEQSGVMC